MEDIFVERTNISYNLRNNDGLLLPRANTTAHGIETIRYRYMYLKKNMVPQNIQ